MQEMEPMALGSPKTPESPTSPGGTGPFLPPYLMGEAAAGSPSHLQSPSPVKQAKHVSFGPLPTVAEASRQQHSFSSPMRSRLNREGPALAVTPDKTGGPPTTGLFDSLNSINIPSGDTPSRLERSSFHAHSGDTPLRLDRSLFQSPPSLGGPMLMSPTAQVPESAAGISLQGPPMESSYYATPDTSALYDDEDTWITVFGFPPPSTSFILQQFTNYGSIMEKRTPAKGNWIHLRYNTRMEARRALSKNGKVFGGAIMVGVMPCRDPDIVGESMKENTSQMLNNAIYSPVSRRGDTPRQGTIRPLTQAYRSMQQDSEVLNRSNTPQKSQSIMVRAMEYVLGW